MKIKVLIWEDTVNYRKPSLFIGTATCSFKCNGCQNKALIEAPDIEIDIGKIIQRYRNNKLTKAIVFGGLEPLDQLNDLCDFCYYLNVYDVFDDLVIYSGYTRQEADEKLRKLRWLNMRRPFIIKYGRYIPNARTKYDKVLGVTLASDNQYAEQISF